MPSELYRAMKISDDPAEVRIVSFVSPGPNVAEVQQHLIVELELGPGIDGVAVFAAASHRLCSHPPELEEVRVGQRTLLALGTRERDARNDERNAQ